MGKIISGKKIIFTGEKETFILRAIIEKVQAVGLECAFVPFTVDALNASGEDISLYILYMDEEVNPREDALHFLIDTMEENGSKLILIGEQIDLNNTAKHLSENLLYKTFSRPVNNDEFIKAIREFFDKSESGEYRKSILIDNTIVVCIFCQSITHFFEFCPCPFSSFLEIIWFIWVETVLRFLNKTVPGDISIDRFQKQVNCFDPGYCNKREFERILSVLKSVEAMPSITIDTSAQAKKTDKGIEINNTLSQNQKQHQEQNQKQEQDIIVDILLESVKDELTGKQRKELLAIAKAAKDLKEAHKGILEKLKEYGENRASRSDFPRVPLVRRA